METHQEMSQLDSNCPSNHNHDPFYQWLCKHRLEMFYNKLLEEGFEIVEDFEGLSENELIQLWNKIGNDKIGFRNRFLKSIKTICLKPVIAITDEERTILSSLKHMIQKYESIIETHETILAGMS